MVSARGVLTLGPKDLIKRKLEDGEVLGLKSFKEAATSRIRESHRIVYTDGPLTIVLKDRSQDMSAIQGVKVILASVKS